MSASTTAEGLRARLRTLFPATEFTDVTSVAMKIVRMFRGYPQVILNEVMARESDAQAAAVRFIHHHAEWGPRLRGALSTQPAHAVNNRQMRADFSYTLLGTDILAITDHGGDFRSVTNDAENVIDELGRGELLSANRHVIYRDTSGTWDGMLIRQMADGRWRFVAFVPLQRDNVRDAITAMIEFMATPKADQAVAA